MSMSSSYVCPCCFLNRISSLRNTPESSREPINQEAHGYSHRCLKDFPTTSSSRSPEVNANSSSLSNSNKAGSEVSLGKSDSDILDNHNFRYPQRLVNNSVTFQSSETFTIEESNPSLLTVSSKAGCPASVAQSRDNTVFLAQQIECMLQEQRKFVKDLDLPISDEGGFTLKQDQLIEVQVTNEGDSIRVNRKVMSKANQLRKEKNKKAKIGRFTNDAVYFASGDQDNSSIVKEGKNSSNDTLSGTVLNLNKVKQLKKQKKLKDNFREEPVKLSKKTEWAVPLQNSFNFNRNPNTDKTISVKMIFRPEGELKCSTSSIESCGEATSIATTSSAYVTAINSYNDGFRESSTNEAIYTIAGSSSNLSLNITNSESRGFLKETNTI